MNICMDRVQTLVLNNACIYIDSINLLPTTMQIRFYRKDKC